MDEATGAGVWRIGDVVDGRYEVSRVLGRGGMGVVHQVRHLAWGVDLAVKSPLPGFFGGAADQELFLTEAEVWVSVGFHPNVCACHYVRVLDGIPRVFAEYVPGGSVSEWIDDGRLYAGGPEGALPRILDCVIQMAWGLEHAHRRGLVHQDVKPANVLLDTDGTAKITDFGLARARAMVSKGPDAPAGASIPVSTGGMTPAYASPEQIRSQPLGRRTDVYSFAVSVLEMFTGGVTWTDGRAAGQALDAYRAGRAGRLGLPAMPAGLASVLERCLRPDPAHRPASMATVVAELTAVHRQVFPDRRPPRAPVEADLRADEFNNRGLSLLDLGRPAEADHAFTQALAEDPQHLAAIYNTGLVRWRRGAITDLDLVAELEAVRAEAGNPWQARVLLAQAQMERGDLAAARTLLDEVERDRPGEPDVRTALRTIQARRITDARCVSVHDVPWHAYPGQAPLGHAIRLTGDGRLAVAGSQAGLVRVWDVHSGRCRLNLDGHGDRVDSVDVTADGRFAASAAMDGTVRFWDLTAGRCVRTVGTPRITDSRGPWFGPSNRFRSPVRLSADGSIAVWAEMDGRAQVWDLPGGQRRLLLDRQSGERPMLLEVSSDGRWALTSGDDQGASLVRLWDLDTGRCRWSRTERGSAVTALWLASDGGHAAIASREITIRGEFTFRLWDLRTERCVRTITWREHWVTCVTVSADLRHAVTGRSDGLAYWDLDSGRCLRTFQGHDEAVETVLLAEDASSVLAVSADDTARRWRLPGDHASAPQLSRPSGQDESRRLDDQVAALVGQAEEAITAGRYPVALDLLTQARTVPGRERAPRALSAWRALSRHTVRAALRTSWPLKVLPGHTDAIRHVELSADGRLAVSGGENGEVRLWEVATGACLHAFDDRADWVTDVGLSSDHRRVLAAHEGGHITVWSADTGECLRSLRVRGNHPTVRLSSDGRLALVSFVREHNAQLWDLDRGTLVRAVRLDDSISGCCVDGSRRVVTCDWNALVRLWDLDDGTCLDSMRGDRSHVRSLCMSEDGRLVLTCGNHGMRLWRPMTGEPARTLGDPGARADHGRLSADGRIAVSASLRSVSVWDVVSGDRLRTFEGPPGHPMTSVAVSADGRVVMTGSSDWNVRLWELDWDLDAREQADWDDGARPHLESFLRRSGPSWTAEDFDDLLRRLEHAGFGWLRADGVRAELGRMTWPLRP